MDYGDNHKAEDLRIEVSVGGKIRRMDLSSELSITSDNPQILNEQMTKQPAIYAWVGVLQALASDQYDRKRGGLKALYAELDNKHRNRRDKHDLKITEAIISSDVESDAVYVKNVKEVYDAKLNRDILTAALLAFEQRKDMLISVASNLRHERDNELIVLKEKAREKIRAGRDQ